MQHNTIVSQFHSLLILILTCLLAAYYKLEMHQVCIETLSYVSQI